MLIRRLYTQALKRVLPEQCFHEMGFGAGPTSTQGPRFSDTFWRTELYSSRGETLALLPLARCLTMIVDAKRCRRRVQDASGAKQRLSLTTLVFLHWPYIPMPKGRQVSLTAI